MKKLMTLMLGLAFLTATGTIVFAQDQPQPEQKTEKKKKSKKSKKTPPPEEQKK